MSRFFLFSLVLLPFLSAAQVVDTSLARIEVDSLMQLNRKLVGQQSFDEALRVIELAEGKAVSAFGENSSLYAQCLFNHGRSYHIMGNYDQAEPLYLVALAIREKVLGKENNDYADNLNNLAVLYRDNGEYDKSEQIHLEAKAIREKVLGKEHPSYASSLNNLANIYKDKMEFYKAEPMYLEALAIREKVFGKEHPDYASSLNNLATLYHEKEEYDKAEPLYLEVKAIQEKLLRKEQPEYAATLNNLANLYWSKGEYDKAEPMHLEAKAIREKVLGKEHPEYALSLNNLANIYYEKGEYYKTESLYLEAKSIREKVLGKEHPDYASSLNNLATLYDKMGENDKSESLYLENLAILEKVFGKEHPSYASGLWNLALHYEDLGQSKKFEQYFTEVYTNTNRALQKSATYLPSQELEKHIALDQFRIGLFYEFNNRTNSDTYRIASYNNALLYKGFGLETATRLETAMRNAPDSIRDIHSNWKGYNRLLASELALPIAERLHAVYLDSMSNVLEKVMLRAAPGFADAQRQIVWQDVRDALQPGEAAVEFIHYSYYDKIAMNSDKSYYSALVTVPGGDAPQFILLCEAQQLDALVYKTDGTRTNYLLNLYASPRADSLRSLKQLLWSPIEKLLREQGVKTVYFSPAGLLHRLNLGAIAEGKSGIPLAEFYRLVPMGSTRLLAERMQEGLLAEGTKAEQLATVRSTKGPIELSDALIYGGVRYEMDSSAISKANSMLGAMAQDTTGGLFSFANQTNGQRGENWDYLPGTEKEARYLDGLLRRQGINTTLRLGYDATEESFKQIGQNGPSPSLLHIGTHGFFFPDPQDTTRRRASLNGDEPIFKVSEYSMIRSGLKLAGSKYAWENGHPLPGGHEDGILTAYEVSQMNLSNTQLVVLSACETGLGDIRGNEGVYGLQRAFRIAGAKNVLMSLWKVPDDATEKLMTRFYHHWLVEKKPLRKSFEAAQQWLRGQKGFENPYYWAGFVLVGEL